MIGLDANISRFYFTCAKLDAGAFQVVSFTGTEEVSRLFRFDLHLVSTDPEIDFAAVINQPATFTVERDLERVNISGLVVHLEQAGASPDHFVYRAQLVPRLWRLSLNFQSRVFQHMAVDEIVEEVLQQAGLSAGVDFRFELQRGLQPREYCVQHRETDLDFVNRLLEHEGICYFFEHDGEREVLVMTDDRASHPPIEGDNLILYQPDASMVHHRETIYEAVYREGLVSEQVLLADFNDQTPEDGLRGESAQLEGQRGMYYSYGEHVKDASAAAVLAEIRLQEIECQRRLLEGRSDCAGFRSGHTFTLEGHYRGGLNQEYLLTRVEHRGSQRLPMGLAGVEEHGGDDDPLLYENAFTAIPANAPYRPPRRTPVPRVPGLLTAKLETAGGEYAYLDEQGRYRFKNLFDLDETQPAQASLPARKVQHYSGAGYGMHFPDHAENEVVLAFENGDLDRPIIVGSMPNPAHATPVTSENRTQNIIRTYAGNQILIEDRSGATKISLTTAGGHVATMDDGGPHILHATSGGHTLRMDDDGKRVFLHTTTGHGLNMEDEVKVVTLFTKEGHSLVFDDPSKTAILQTIDGHTLFLDDSGKQVRLYTTDGHAVRLSDQDNTIEVMTKSGNNKVVLDEGAGHITVDAKDEVTVVTGESTLNMKKDGTISLTGKKISIVADDEVKISAKKVETTGQQEAKMGVGTQAVTCNNQKVETSGAAITAAAIGIHEISGAMVKIN